LKNSEVRIQESEYNQWGIPYGKQATDPPLIEDHQIENLAPCLNPFIHPPVAQNSYWILAPDSWILFDKKASN